MSHKTPSKTDFSDDFRESAACREVVKESPELATAWDNIDVGTWKETKTIPDPEAQTAKNICFACKVRLECLKDALSDNEAEGIRAGFRFESGYVTKEDARKLYNEFGIRGKVKKMSRITRVENQEV